MNHAVYLRCGTLWCSGDPCLTIRLSRGWKWYLHSLARWKTLENQSCQDHQEVMKMVHGLSSWNFTIIFNKRGMGGKIHFLPTPNEVESSPPLLKNDLYFIFQQFLKASILEILHSLKRGHRYLGFNSHLCGNMPFLLSQSTSIFWIPGTWVADMKVSIRMQVPHRVMARLQSLWETMQLCSFTYAIAIVFSVMIILLCPWLSARRGLCSEWPATQEYWCVPAWCMIPIQLL